MGLSLSPLQWDYWNNNNIRLKTYNNNEICYNSRFQTKHHSARSGVCIAASQPPGFSRAHSKLQAGRRRKTSWPSSLSLLKFHTQSSLPRLHLSVIEEKNRLIPLRKQMFPMQATNFLTLTDDMNIYGWLYTAIRGIYACLCLKRTCYVSPYFLLHITSAGLDPRLPSELP